MRYIITLSTGAQIATDFDSGQEPTDPQGYIPAPFKESGMLHILGVWSHHAHGSTETPEFVTINPAHIVSVRDTAAI